jgi:ssRNA-specific RNase YbeY (16S rRNA maturation enzyme)
MKVKICGIEHEISYEEDKFDAQQTHFGQIDFTNAKILINRNATKAIREETLCHEVIHGILVHLGYEELNDNEQFVSALSNAIYQSFDVKVYD